MPPGFHHGVQLLASGVRAVLLGCGVAVALLGALTGPPRVTLVGAVLGGGVAVAAPRLAAWGLELARPSPPTLALAVTIGALVVPTVLGLALLGPAGPVLALAPLLVVRPPRAPAATRPARGAPPLARCAGRRAEWHG